DRVSLVGLSSSKNPVVIENAGGQDQGIAVAKPGDGGPACLTDASLRIDGAVVRGLTVNGFDGDGIFLFCADNWLVAQCETHDNNRPNTCLNPSDEVCAVPPGTGLLVLAADANQVDHNTVTGNDSFGIAVANFCVANNLPPEVCAALDIEPNPDNDSVTFNVATGNGGNPSPLINPAFAVDLAWDTTGTGNCWTHNTAGTQFPSSLPACGD